MKRLVVSILILVFAVGISIFSVIFIKNSCNEAVSGLDDILSNAITENAEEVNRLAVQTNEYWESKKFLMNILIGQQYTNNITKTLHQIIFFAEIGDYESVLLHTEECKEDLHLIIESNEPKLSTVF